MKRVIAFILFLCCCLMSACDTSSSIQSTDTVAERAYCEEMTTENFTLVTNDIVNYVSEISVIFSQMASISQKYANTINSSDVFDWSQHWDFREAKENAIEICDKIIAYDDSICSKEYQLCIDELKSMAYQIEFFFNIVSQEIDIDLLNTLTQNLSNAINLGMNNAIIYQTMATIAYMENSNADTSELKLQIADIYLYKIVTDSGNGIKFTNAYGTSTTKCNHYNCSNSIAILGDTNCCIVHSNKCNNCGTYIDEDALFCMDCLSGKIIALENTVKYITGISNNRCQYTDFYGVVCNKNTNKYASLCDAHFNKLHNTYCDLISDYYDFST